MIAIKSKWESEWKNRPSEEATNFNPAFCAELFARATAEYKKVEPDGMPFSLAFLILPLALHQTTREILPGRASVALIGWVAENGPIIADLPERIGRLVPVTRESLIFSLQYDVLQLVKSHLIPGKKPIRLTAKLASTTQDVDHIRGAASMLGRWFANQNNVASIIQSMGIRL